MCLEHNHLEEFLMQLDSIQPGSQFMIELYLKVASINARY
jgi:hypothetical protein